MTRALYLHMTRPAQAGPLQPFCGAVMTMSTPRASMSTHMHPDATQSNTNSLRGEEDGEMRGQLRGGKDTLHWDARDDLLVYAQYYSQA